MEIYLPLLLLFLYHVLVCLCGGNMSRQAVLNVLLGMGGESRIPGSKYDSSIAPDFERDVATDVNIQIHIQNIYSVSESSMDYSMDIYLQQRWEDPRLVYENMTDLMWLEMDNKMMDNVWVPDTFFSNEKKASVHDVTVPNRMMHIYYNGTVLYSSRLSLTLSCSMNLKKYPLDEQVCPIVVESYAYTKDNVVYHWENDNPVRILYDSEMPQFQASVDSALNTSCRQRTNTREPRSVSDTFIRLKRKVGYYIVQMFVPSVLIVVLSWVSFWVDHDAVPARVSLGVLTVLTMTTQSSGAKQSLPLVSYVKAIDVWMFTCLLFVFAALVEYSYVNVVARRRTKAIVHMQHMELQPLTQDPNRAENGKSHKWNRMSTMLHQSNIAARRVDKISRIVFPVCFLMFNVAFWTYYSYIPNPSS